MSAFARAPFIVVWETTRACALACVHCRAEAMPHRDPDELTTEEARRLIDRVAAFGDPPPLFVFTGGDPLRRAVLGTPGERAPTDAVFSGLFGREVAVLGGRRGEEIFP